MDLTVGWLCEGSLLQNNFISQATLYLGVVVERQTLSWYLETTSLLLN